MFNLIVEFHNGKVVTYNDIQSDDYHESENQINFSFEAMGTTHAVTLNKKYVMQLRMVWGV